MKLDQKQIKLLVNLQESMAYNEVKFLVFHEDQRYRVTNQLDVAIEENNTIFVVTSNNVVSLGPVLTETKEEIKQQVDMILSLMKKEQKADKQLEREEALPLTILAHPTYTADLFTVIAYELEYGSEEIHTMLANLERMQPIYAEYFQKNRKAELTELTFVAEKILLKMNKSKEAVEMFVKVLEEKAHSLHSHIEQQATSVLTDLLFEQMDLL
jgi:hypothetical protein